VERQTKANYLAIAPGVLFFEIGAIYHFHPESSQLVRSATLGAFPPVDLTAKSLVSCEVTTGARPKPGSFASSFFCRSIATTIKSRRPRRNPVRVKYAVATRNPNGAIGTDHEAGAVGLVRQVACDRLDPVGTVGEQ
jgi:hypothetical protein